MPRTNLPIVELKMKQSVGEWARQDSGEAASYSIVIIVYLHFPFARLQRQIRDLRDDISEAERKESDQTKRRKTAVSYKSTQVLYRNIQNVFHRRPNLKNCGQNTPPYKGN